MAPHDCRVTEVLQLIGGMVGCADFCNTSRMTEGRQSQVVLLDDRRLDILIKPKLYAGELLDMVSSHFSLKEKEYFGLAYIDDTGHHSWLQLDRRVLEHEFPKKSSQSTLILYFRIKYFVESITHLRDSTTIEAFYLQAQSLIYQGTVEVSSDTAFHLAALVLQATHGDYINDETTKQHLKKLPVLPTSALQEHPSLTVCEDRVIERYKALKEQSRGTAIVNYLRIVEAVPTYGVHYYEVKDKGSIPWWLGISCKGISQYDQTDRKIPRKVFLWKQLENLYFRDRKFSIEVYDPRRVPLSRRTFGPGNVTVHVWFASTPSLTKCIWSMAIAQHQFYLDRKHNKASLSVSRSLSEIAAELSHSVHSLSSTDSSPSLSRSASSLSLPALKIDSDCCEEVKTEIVEMFVALKARKEALEEALHKKSEELKKLCLQEGKLTGVLPPEMPLTPGEQIPIVERRKGTELSLDEKIVWKTKTAEDEDLSRLELEYEIQSKIASAALKLATDPTVPKNIRRQRKVSSLKACSKLKEIEQKLEKLRKKIETKKQQQRQHSDDEPSEDNMSHSTDENDPVFQEVGLNLSYLNIGLSQQESSIEDAKNSVNREMTSPLNTNSHIICSTSSNSAPPSPTKPRHAQQQQPVAQHLSPNKLNVTKVDPNLDGQGYTPSSVYQTQTSYRTQQYPTLPTRSPSSYSAGAIVEYNSSSNFNLCDKTTGILMLRSPYQNRFESTLDIEGSNLYSVPTQRTSQAFDSQDDILACVPNNLQDLGLMSRHNSLDRSRRQSYQRYRRYIENTQNTVDFIRPSLVQPSLSCDEHLSYNQFVTEADVHQYHNHHHLQHHLPLSASCTFHHPHHFHHHRHSQQHLCQPDGASRTNTKLDKMDRYQDLSHLDTKNDTYGSCMFSGNPPFQTGYLSYQAKHSHILNDCQNSFTKEILQSDVPKSRENVVSPLSYSDSKSSLVCHSHLNNSLCPQSASLEEQTSHITASMTKCNISSKRTKSWNETSLDSPVPQKKYEGKETRANNFNSKSFSIDPVYRHQSDETLSQSHQILPCATMKHLPVSSQVCTFKDELAPLIPSQSDVEISVLNYGHFQPYWEETKPYEISDFYKYSTKHRKQNQDASQSLHTKISASKTSVRSGLCHATVPKIMSPVQEHSAITSSISSLLQNNNGKDKIKHHTAVHGEVLLSEEMRTEAKFPPLSNTSNLSYMFGENSSEAPVSDPFQDELFEWHTKREKFIKTTLV